MYYEAIKINGIPLFYRDKPTFEQFKVDFQVFANWLKKKYPQDEEIPVQLLHFEQKYQHLPMNVRFEKELSRRNSKTSSMDEVKKMLLKTYSTDCRVVTDYTVDLTSIEGCVKSFRDLQNLIQSDKRNVLLNSSKQGEVLKTLKNNSNKSSSFFKCIEEKEISISLSHCNFLISFHELSKQHPNILRCSLELRFFKTNMKTIKAVIQDMPW